MNQDDDGNIIIAAQGGAAAAANKARLTLPLFEGKNDARATRDFCLKVDSYKAVARLTDAKTAQAVSFAMVQGSAADLWLTNLMEENPANAALWTTLRPLLMARFSPDLTASERAAATDHCKQGRGEDVLMFLDQCRATQLLLDRSIPAEEKTGGQEAAYRARLNNSILQLFLRGLREEGGLKSHVNGALRCNTLAEYRDAATRHERHVSKQIKVVVAEMTTGDDQKEANNNNDSTKVANLKIKKKKKNSSNGTQSNNGALTSIKGLGKASENGTSAGAAGGAGPRLCWTCSSPEHMNYQCPANPKAKKGSHPNGGNTSSTHMTNHALNAAIYQMGIAQLLNHGNKSCSEGRLNAQESQPPLTVQANQYPGLPGSTPGFY